MLQLLHTETPVASVSREVTLNRELRTMKNDATDLEKSQVEIPEQRWGTKVSSEAGGHSRVDSGITLRWGA